MSWGRLDDGYWKHPKTLALVDQGGAGLAAAGAFWILDSYCLRQHSSSFTIWEAAMVLRRSNDEAAQILVPLLVPPDGFERGFLLRKQDGSYEINSFLEYKGKSQAKVEAGSKGGKKSAETRRSKSKQSPSTSEADHEQSGSTIQAPGSRSRHPIPDPDPGSRIPSPDPGAASVVTTDQPLKDFEIEQLGFSRFGAFVGKNASELKRLEPRREELDEAMRRSPNARTYAYLAPVIADIREERSKPPPPGYQPPRNGSGRRVATAEELDRAGHEWANEKSPEEIPDA